VTHLKPLYLAVCGAVRSTLACGPSSRLGDPYADGAARL